MKRSYIKLLQQVCYIWQERENAGNNSDGKALSSSNHVWSLFIFSQKKWHFKFYKEVVYINCFSFFIIQSFSKLQVYSFFLIFIFLLLQQKIKNIID